MNVIDFATKKPLPKAAFQMSASELADYAKAHEGPDFVKKRGQMVITPETKDQTDRLFEVFALGIRSDGDPDRQINTWAWLAAQVGTALRRYARGKDFDILERVLRPPDFIAYVVALAQGDKAAASEAAKRLGAYDGLDSDHPQAKLLDL